MTPRTTRALLGISVVTAALSLAPAAHAQDAPDKPRAVTFKDGRTYIGEIVTTEAGGMRMRLPQGETVIGFYAFRGIKASNVSAWRAQREWEVLVVGPDAARIWIEQNIRSYPAIKVSGDDGLSRSLSLDARRRAKACGPADLTCIEAASSRTDGWNWIVTVEPGANGSAVLRGGLSTGEDTARKRVVIGDISDPDAVLTALDDIMGLENVSGRSASAARLASLAPKVDKAPKDPKEKRPKEPKDKTPKEPKEKQPKEPKEPKEKKPKVAKADKGESLGLDVLVPLPGYPSLKRGDMSSFGMAIGVAVPATAVWVAATGGESQSIPEHALLSAGGYYVSTIFVNHLMGRRTLNNAPNVSLSPSQGGATLRVDGRF